MKSLGAIAGTAVWVAGIILAKGFWATLGAVLLPFVAWYIVVKHALIALGWVS